MPEQNEQSISMEDLAIMIKQGFDGVDEKFKGVDEKFKGVDEKFKEVHEKLDLMDKRLERIEQSPSQDYGRRIKNLEVDVANIKETFTIK